MFPARFARVAEVVLAGILLGCAGCRSAPAPRPSGDSSAAEAMARYSLGLLAESRDDSASALSHFEEAIRLDPAEERLYLAAAYTALRLNQPETAEELADRLTKIHPDSEKTLLLLARIYFLTDRPEQAESFLLDAARRFPESEESHASLIQFYLSDQQREKTFEALLNAAEILPESALFPQLLGFLYIETAERSDDPEQAFTLYEEAVFRLRKALELEPDNAAAWLQLSLALSALNRPEEALEAVQTARNIEPGNLLSARHLLDLLVKTEQFQKAVDACESLAAETGTMPVLWLQYLTERMPVEHRNILIAHFESRLEEEPKAPVLYPALLGTLLAEEGEKGRAQAVLTEALEQYPDDYRLQAALGSLYLEDELYEMAYEQLNRARESMLKMDVPDLPLFRFHLLAAAHAGGHIEEAADLLEEMRDATPDLFNRYVQALLAGQLPASEDDSIALLVFFHENRTETPLTLYTLMFLFSQQERYEEALQTWQRLKLAGETGSVPVLDDSFYYQYGFLLERTGRIEDAETAFYKAIEKAEEAGNEMLSAAAKNHIAYMRAERGEKLDTGLVLVREALRVDPENGAFIDTLGWIYYMQGRYEEALQELKRALSYAEDEPEILEHLGDTWLKLDRPDRAAEYWKRALELDPELDYLRERLESHGVKDE